MLESGNLTLRCIYFFTLQNLGQVFKELEWRGFVVTPNPLWGDTDPHFGGVTSKPAIDRGDRDVLVAVYHMHQLTREFNAIAFQAPPKYVS